jgi:hypothetical protein
LQAVGFKTGVNFTHDVLANGIGFDDGQGAFYGHGRSPDREIKRSAQLYGFWVCFSSRIGGIREILSLVNQGVTNTGRKSGKNCTVEILLLVC